MYRTCWQWAWHVWSCSWSSGCTTKGRLVSTGSDLSLKHFELNKGLTAMDLDHSWLYFDKDWLNGALQYCSIFKLHYVECVQCTMSVSLSVCHMIYVKHYWQDFEVWWMSWFSKLFSKFHWMVQMDLYNYISKHEDIQDLLYYGKSFVYNWFVKIFVSIF